MPRPDNTIGGRRLALLIATSDYSDRDLRQLRAPGRDASELAGVLRDPKIGSFEVQTLINARSGDVQEKIEEFCADRHPDDQLLIYLSCHGVLDDSGRLYYATTNTRRQREAATSVAATWLNERLDDCRARRQIVLLDCCHSGAFARGAKGDADLALQQRFQPHGRGRVVLTASRSTEYSFEGGQVSGEGVRSAFTHAIVDGLRTGEADRDKDGLITVADLYQHVYDKVRSAEPRQSPELWLYAAEGTLLVARSVQGAVIKPVVLPEDLRITLESPRPRVRETGVVVLAELVDSAEPGLALTARQALQRIAAEDLPRVAALAQAALGAPDGTAADQVGGQLAERGRKEEQERREAQEKARQQAKEETRRKAESQKAAIRSLMAERQPGRDDQGHTGVGALAAAAWQASPVTLRGWRARRGLLLVAVLTAAVVVLGGLRVASSVQSAQVYQRVGQLADLSGKVTGLAQALQNERQDTVQYIVLGTDGRADGLSPVKATAALAAPELAVLQKDYGVTSRWARQASGLLRGIDDSYPALAQQDASGALAAISGLPALRQAAAHTELPPLQVIQSYAAAISSILAVDDQVAVGSNDSTLADSVRVASLMSKIKEEASQQQAILTSAQALDLSGSGQFDPSQQAAINEAQAEQQGNLTDYNENATAAQKQLYHNAVSGTAVVNAQQQEQQAISVATSGQANASDPTIANASAAMTYLVTSFRSAESQLVNSVIARSKQLRNNAITSVIAIGMLFIVLALLFIAVLRTSTIRAIQRGRNNPRNGVRLRGSQGEETQIPADSRSRAPRHSTSTSN